MFKLAARPPDSSLNSSSTALSSSESLKFQNLSRSEEFMPTFKGTVSQEDTGSF